MEPESLNLVQSQWFRWLVELLLSCQFQRIEINAPCAPFLKRPTHLCAYVFTFDHIADLRLFVRLAKNGRARPAPSSPAPRGTTTRQPDGITNRRARGPKSNRELRPSRSTSPPYRLLQTSQGLDGAVMRLDGCEPSACEEKSGMGFGVHSIRGIMLRGARSSERGSSSD